MIVTCSADKKTHLIYMTKKGMDSSEYQRAKA